MTAAEVLSDDNFQRTPESGCFDKPFNGECAEYLKLAVR